jgi:hypothetical protein
LSEEEYDEVVPVMIDRYRTLSLEDILARSRPLNMLCAWQQAGDAEGPAALMSAGTQTDEA